MLNVKWKDVKSGITKDCNNHKDLCRSADKSHCKGKLRKKSLKDEVNILVVF